MNADERIAELMARAGQPVMVVKGDQPSTSQEHLRRIEKRAKQMAKELHSPKYECTIAIMCDEIVRQDAQIRNMADTIDRLEAALSNVIGEREQLKRELHESATAVRGSSLCCYCKHEDKTCQKKPCDTCVRDRDRPGFEWHGLQEVQQHGERVD